MVQAPTGAAMKRPAAQARQRRRSSCTIQRKEHLFYFGGCELQQFYNVPGDVEIKVRAQEAASSGNRSGQETAVGSRRMSCRSIWAWIVVVLATLLFLVLLLWTLGGYGDPARLVLEVSCELCAFLYLWSYFIKRELSMEYRGGHRIGGRALLRLLRWIVFAGVVAIVASVALSTVTAMLIMYIATLCVAGFFGFMN
ncbi:hypothetical protein ACP70R_003753 [Stipagrostis hirtigluma subsp. patula]